MTKPIRIGIAGPSGVGKSTLAEWVAKEFNIPFITSSTKPLWDKYGINNHAELIQKTLINPQWGLDFQNEVLDYRINAVKGVESFIIDRTPLDNLVYFLMQNSHTLGEEQTEFYIQRCKEAMSIIDGLIWLKFTDEVVLENDNKRIANKYYQHMTESVFECAAGLLSHEALHQQVTMTVPFWDFERRKKVTTNFIKMLSGEIPLAPDTSVVSEDTGLKLLKDEKDKG